MARTFWAGCRPAAVSLPSMAWAYDSIAVIACRAGSCFLSAKRAWPVRKCRCWAVGPAHVRSFISTLCLLSVLLPIRHHMRKLRDLFHLGVRRDLLFSINLNPVIVEHQSLDVGSIWIIRGFLGTQVLVLRRNVRVNSSTFVLCFDATLIFHNKRCYSQSRGRLARWML